MRRSIKASLASIICTLPACVQCDQDIVDLLNSLKPESVTCEGGMYAAALPPPPKPASAYPLPHITIANGFANGPEVSLQSMLKCLASVL